MDRDQKIGRTAEEIEHPDMAGDPVLKALCPRRLGEGVVRRAQHADEYLGLANLEQRESLSTTTSSPPLPRVLQREHDEKQYLVGLL